MTLAKVLGRTFPPSTELAPRVWRSLGGLALLSFATGYQGSVTSAAMTYVGREFGASTAEQSRSLAIIRFDIIVTIILMAFADRVGRRRMLVVASTGGPLLTALCGVAPNLVAFTAMQLIARGFVTAMAALIAVVVVEELPSAARSWASSLLVVAAAVGTGGAVGIVALADNGMRAWRFFYLVAVLFVGLAMMASRRLVETERFVITHARAPIGSLRDAFMRLGADRRRLVVMALFLALLAFENTPTRQLQNEYLRLERGFSSTQVALFSVFSNLPGIVGLFLGGLVGDRIGHRRILFVAIGAFAIGDAGIFLTRGSAMWFWSIFGSLLGAASVPIVAIFSAEVFPTSVRSFASGVITFATRLAGALGLVFVGQMSHAVSRGTALALTSAALVISIVLLPLVPETSARRLEELNAEDAELWSDTR